MNPRTTTALKLARGTFRADRLPKVSAAGRLAAVPRPPKGMPACARAEWKALAPTAIAMGLLREVDLRSFRLACELLGATVELQRAIDTEGVVVNEKLNPKLKALESARVQALRGLGEIGMSPRAKNYVAAMPAPVRSRLDAIEDGLE